MTATCARVITGYTPAPRRQKNRIISPPVFSIGSNTDASTPPILTRVDEEESGVYSSYSNKLTSIHVEKELNSATHRSSGVSQRLTSDNVTYQPREYVGGASIRVATNATIRTSMGDSAYISRRVTEISGIETVETVETAESAKLASKDTPLDKQVPSATESVAPTEVINQMTGINRQTTGSSPSPTPPFLTPSHHSRFAEEPRSKYRWSGSPRMAEQVNTKYLCS